MKRCIALLFFLYLGCGPIMGCSEHSRQESREAATAVEADAEREKQEFVHAMEAKLDELDRKLLHMKAKAETASDAAKAEIHQQIEALERQRDAVQRKLGELNTASAQSWKDLKSGVETALDDLEKSFERASSRIGI